MWSVSHLISKIRERDAALVYYAEYGVQQRGDLAVS